MSLAFAHAPSSWPAPTGLSPRVSQPRRAFIAGVRGGGMGGLWVLWIHLHLDHRPPGFRKSCWTRNTRPSPWGLGARAWGVASKPHVDQVTQETPFSPPAPCLAGLRPPLGPTPCLPRDASACNTARARRGVGSLVVDPSTMGRGPH